MRWCETAEQLCPVRELGDGLVEWALGHVTDGLFIDGGAHVGLFCIPVLLERSAARCVAFEPNPAAYGALCEMAALNGVADRLLAYQVALWEHDDVRTLKTPVTASSCGLSTLGEPRRFGHWKTWIVLAATLDSYNLAPQLVKLDLEGAERYALEGARATLRAHHPALIVEAYAPNTAQFGYEPGEIGRFLEGLGYCCQQGREDLLCTT